MEIVRYRLVLVFAFVLQLEAINSEATIRLVGGRNYYTGRLEVLIDGVWGTVCDHGWGPTESTIACRHLGFTGARFQLLSFTYYDSDNPILLNSVDCGGNETRLADCTYSSIGLPFCLHFNDISLECIHDGAFRFKRLGSTCLSGVQLSNSTNVQSRTSCAVMCSNTSQCRSFNYEDDTRVCSLNTEIAANVDTNQKTGACLYYEKVWE